MVAWWWLIIAALIFSWVGLFMALLIMLILAKASAWQEFEERMRNVQGLE